MTTVNTVATLSMLGVNVVRFCLPQSYELMRLPPRDATAEGDLTIPFQQSALKSTADQDPFFQHLKIRYVKAADSSEAAQVD